MKKLFALLILICIFSNAVALQYITNYKVPASARLGEKITVYGYYNDDNAPDSNALVLCRFDIFDLNGNLVERLTDEFVFKNGSFSTERLLQQPPYFWGDDFNIQTTCNSAVASSVFTVENFLGVAHPAQQTTEYLFNQSNLNTAAMIGSFIIIIICIFIVGAWMYKRVKEGI